MTYLGCLLPSFSEQNFTESIDSCIAVTIGGCGSFVLHYWYCLVMAAKRGGNRRLQEIPPPSARACRDRVHRGKGWGLCLPFVLKHLLSR